MLTIKNRVRNDIVFFLTLAVCFAGCTPPGPRALLDGQRLIEQGRYTDAVEKLQVAVSLMETNAHAWNYLALALHHAKLPADAEKSYQRALALNRDLIEARFNLGCLWLEQNRPDLAKAELTAYTLRQAHAGDGWAKLGTAHLRLGEWPAAERSFSEALRRRADSVEALNGLGLVQLQRNRPREAASYFAGALKHQPDYAPSLLNLAIVSHIHLADHPFALHKYREYLALKPPPANQAEVAAVARSIEQELALAARPPPPVAAAPPPEPASVAAVPSNVVAAAKSATNVATTVTNVAAATKPATNVIARVAPTSKPEPSPQPVTTSPPPPAPAPAPAPSASVEVVQLPPEPVIKPIQDIPVATTPPGPTPTAPRESTPPPPPTPDVVADEPKDDSRRGFLQRVNPANLLRRESKPAPRPTPLPPVAGSAESEPAKPAASTPSVTPERAPVASPDAPSTPSVPRYTYRRPAKPASGDRAAAEAFLQKGLESQRAGRLPDALQAFREATQADPAYYEAHYNHGLIAAESGNVPAALAAFETALAIRPEATDARYNFAMVLKQANFPLDAVSELEKTVATQPADSRAHLALANLYAQQFRDTAKARQHYLKVLEIDPRHPQGAAIRYWLSGNPQ